MDINQILMTIFQCLPGFLLAITVHEWAHGMMAKKFGDPTAEQEGRLTLNPTVHLDPVGTFVIPMICLALGGAIFGYAKPVPVDMRNVKPYKKGLFWISFAGPLSNIVLGSLSAFCFAAVSVYVSESNEFYLIALKMIQYSTFINFLLAVFNLIPFPPLDGSKMVASFLDGENLRKYESLSAYANMFFIGLFALSLAGVHILGYILMPAQVFGQKLTMYFLYMLG